MVALALAAVPVVVAVLGGLLTLPLDKQVIREPFVRDTAPTENEVDLDTPAYSRGTRTFPSKGTTCHAWLYLPKGRPGRRPVVVMAHGIGGQKDMGLHGYAESFVQHGLAAFVFDYRSFGGSDGEPRNHVSPKLHNEDWDSALQYVRAGLEGEVDTSQIVLWGTSFAGGHVLQTAAAQGGSIAAVISQVPFLSGVAASKRGLKSRTVPGAVRFFLAGLRDRLRGLARLPPEYIKIAGRPGELAAMQMDEDELYHYFKKHPKTYMGGWQNRMLARAATQFSRYNPLWAVPKIQVPILMVGVTRDSQCPIEDCHKAVAANPRVQLLTLACGHFDVYMDPTAAAVKAAEWAFLQRHLQLPAEGASA